MAVQKHKVKRAQRRVIILAFDGVDPDLVDQWRKDLPSLDALIGSFDCPRLTTTTPPVSAVAWSTFSTSRGPASHQVYDIWGRDPDTYLPSYGTAEVFDAVFKQDGQLSSPGSAEGHRKGDTFWKVAADAGIPAKVLFVPYTFPPEDLGEGFAFAGTGVPDLRLTPSTSFILDSDLTQVAAREDPAGVDLVRLVYNHPYYEGEISGPRDSNGERSRLSIRFTRDETTGEVLAEGPESRVVLREGQFSEYMGLGFPLSRQYAARALVRFYPLETSAERLRIYMFPLQFDPKSPYINFTYPPSYARLLAETYGVYKTTGRVHDIDALDAGLIPEEVFIKDLHAVFSQRLRMIEGELKRGDADLFIGVFSATDNAARMFQRLMDPRHPAYDKRLAARYGDFIRDTYRWMDEAISRVRSNISPQDIFIVFSTHGYQSFRRELNVNTWLLKNGFLKLRSDVTRRATNSMAQGDVDWGHTRAYAIGNGQIFLNLASREERGIVADEEREGLLDTLSRGLLQVRDPVAPGVQVIKQVHRGRDLFSAEAGSHGAPDLLLSLAEGYQIGLGSRAGEIPLDVVAPNTHKWSGDFDASDPQDAQGFIVATLPGFSQGARLEDIGPTVLARLGIDIPEGVDGRDLLAALRDGGALGAVGVKPIGGEPHRDDADRQED